MNRGRERIQSFFKKFLSMFSIFSWRKAKKQELLKQVNSYNESNLQLLLNSFYFIASTKKINEISGDILHEKE
jgi:hypothetical protein